MAIKVKEVKPLNNMILSVLFENGVQKTYDVKPLLTEDLFAPLEDNPALFYNVKVICGGAAVAWDDNMDIPENELWIHGVEQNG